MLKDILAGFLQVLCVILSFTALVTCGKVVFDRKKQLKKKILPLAGLILGSSAFIYFWFVLGWAH